MDIYTFRDAEGCKRAVHRDQGAGEPGSYLEALSHEALRLAARVEELEGRWARVVRPMVRLTDRVEGGDAYWFADPDDMTDCRVRDAEGDLLAIASTREGAEALVAILNGLTDKVTPEVEAPERTIAALEEENRRLRGFVVWHRHDGIVLKLIPIPAERETAMDSMEVAEGPPIEISLFHSNPQS